MEHTGEVERPSRLMHAAVRAFARRSVVGIALRTQVPALTQACRHIARRFRQGGKLLAFGNGSSSTDAQHIAVEFLHPVLVGKRALPAIALTNDVATLTSLMTRERGAEVFAHQLRSLAHPEDIAVGIARDRDCPSVQRGLAVAKERGLLTVFLTGKGTLCSVPDSLVDHLLVVEADEPEIIKEAHVTLYHILWELVHVFYAYSDRSQPEVDQ